MNGWIADEGGMPHGPTPRLDDDPYALDDTLVDQLLDGADDGLVPASYRPLVDALAAARGPANEAELVGELGAVALFRMHRATGGTVGRRRRRRRATAFLAAGSLAVVTVTGAAAATGSLPDGVQDLAAAMLSEIGIDVPAGSRRGPDHPAAPGPPSILDVESSLPPEALTSHEAADGDGKATSTHAAETSSGIRELTAVAPAVSDSLDPGGMESPSPTPDEPPSSVPAEPPSSTVAEQPESNPTEPSQSNPGGQPPDNPAGPPPANPTGPPPDAPAEPPPGAPAGPPPNPGAPPPAAPPGPPPDAPAGPPPSKPAEPPPSAGPPPSNPAEPPPRSHGPPPSVPDEPLAPPSP